jgi:hypothetical protein
MAVLAALTEQLLFTLQRKALLSPGEIDDLFRDANESISGEGHTQTAARDYLHLLWNDLIAERD